MYSCAHCTVQVYSAVPDTALARCQLARGSSWGMICPLCEMWCGFSPWKSDFHNISTSVTPKHRNYIPQAHPPAQNRSGRRSLNWNCDRAQVHWHCSKVDSGQAWQEEWLRWPDLKPLIIHGHRSGLATLSRSYHGIKICQIISRITNEISAAAV